MAQSTRHADERSPRLRTRRPLGGSTYRDVLRLAADTGLGRLHPNATPFPLLGFT